MALGVDAVLLDNMGPDMLRQAVDMVAAGQSPRPRAASAPTPRRRSPPSGVDLLSVGWLTHSATVLDIGLDHRG